MMMRLKSFPQRRQAKALGRDQRNQQVIRAHGKSKDQCERPKRGRLSRQKEQGDRQREDRDRTTP